MPIGMPGCPDLAASTASIASARIELASSPSDAGEIIRELKLYSAHERASLRSARRLRASGELRGARRRLLVCISRHQPPRRAGCARSRTYRRSARAPAPFLATPVVAKYPPLVVLYFPAY